MNRMVVTGKVVVTSENDGGVQRERWWQPRSRVVATNESMLVINKLGGCEARIGVVTKVMRSHKGVGEGNGGSGERDRLTVVVRIFVVVMGMAVEALEKALFSS